MNNSELSLYIQARSQALREARAKFRFFGIGKNYKPEELHDILTAHFLVFADALYDKAMQAREKYGFHELGWATPDWEQELKAGLLEHLHKGDPRDVGVYAMFAWFHGWSTTPPPAPAAPVEARMDATLTAATCPNNIAGCFCKPAPGFSCELAEKAAALSAAPVTGSRDGEDGLTESMLRELEELTAKLKPGDWYFNNQIDEIFRMVPNAEDDADAEHVALFDDADDALFIELARNRMPALLARIRRLDALAAAPVVDAGPKWVSVQDRLPYYGEVALVAAAHPLGGFSVLQRTFRYIGEDGWQRHDTNGGKPDKVITHWCELPAAPVTLEGSQTNG